MTKKLTPEERRLWRLNTRDVTPLSKDAQKGEEVVEKPPPLKTPAVKPAPKVKKVASPVLPPSLPSLGRKEVRRLKIEARFDMHGLTLHTGYEALERFLIGVQERGLKTVLVITGKGSMSAENTLRSQLPRWLQETPLRRFVVSLHHPAKLQDGGTGAFYVEVRRGDKSRRGYLF
ncbi:MAG: Smr/MutS family protein [Proteobacteria bacterium]|nr:Smr/MutS family protein [Pseudomonadota bacterium]